MGSPCTNRQISDSDAKKKAIKLIVVHIKKKIAKEFLGSEYITQWISEMEELLSKDEFNSTDYIKMRKKLNEVIECTLDEEIRFKLRDSWCSFGRALDRKPKAN